MITRASKKSPLWNSVRSLAEEGTCLVVISKRHRTKREAMVAVMCRELLPLEPVILSRGSDSAFCRSRSRRILWMEGTCQNNEILQSSRKAWDSIRMTGGAFVNATFLASKWNNEKHNAAKQVLKEWSSFFHIHIGLALLILLLLGCRTSDKDSEWPMYKADNHSSSYSELTQINKQNVNRLEVAWTYRTGDLREEGYSTIETNPVIVNGIPPTGTRTYGGPIVTAGGGRGTKPGDYYVAFALPD